MTWAGAACRAVVLVALGLGVAACAAIIGVDSTPESISKKVCVCDDQLPFDGDREDCEDTIDERLSGASEETRAAWLARFQAEACDKCPNVAKCFYTLPTCSSFSCEDAEDCCGYPDGAKCEDGQCK